MRRIFVFGSNLAGVHGLGAARFALLHYRAKMKEGVGLFGDSYALPTKDCKIESLSLTRVLHFVDNFLDFAHQHPELEFKITRIGCGLAGFKDEEIAPMFREAGKNCLFDEAWKQWLPGKQFWGTF